jgi:hypothetical protein
MTKLISDLNDVLLGRAQRIARPGKYRIFWQANRLIVEVFGWPIKNVNCHS